VSWGYLYCSAMNAAAYTLEPVDGLGPGDTAGVRRIFEDGFAPHLRSEFGTLTTGREPGEIPLALVHEGQPRGFVMLRPLGATGWMFLRYFVVDQHVRGQGLGGIMWDQLMARLRQDGYPLLVWDVEDPDEPGTDPDEVRIRRRRIAFYQRHGGQLLPIAGYGNPHGDDWTPMRLMAAPTAGPAGDGAASLPETAAVLGAVYEFRWRLGPADPRVSATRVTDEQKGQ
jgi:GNAT superfamily N-acetyltransferase